mgnify:CR=1 FL=1
MRIAEKMLRIFKQSMRMIKMYFLSDMNFVKALKAEFSMYWLSHLTKGKMAFRILKPIKSLLLEKKS